MSFFKASGHETQPDKSKGDTKNNKVVPLQPAVKLAEGPTTENKGEHKGNIKVAPVESLQLYDVPENPTKRDFVGWHEKLKTCHRLSIYDPLLNTHKLNCIKDILEDDTTRLRRVINVVKFTRIKFSEPGVIQYFHNLITFDLIPSLIFNDSNLQKDDFFNEFLEAFGTCTNMYSISFTNTPFNMEKLISLLEKINAQPDSQIRHIHIDKMSDFDKTNFTEFLEKNEKLLEINFSIGNEIFKAVPKAKGSCHCLVM